ncbi:hypothetical protein ACFL25_00510 [Patescibacteria group bacterium]
MSKLTFAIVVISIIILTGGVLLLSREGGENQALGTVTSPSQHQYFWSETCPHCANVAEFIKTWEGKEKFEMEKYEVNESGENRNLFIENGTKICKKPANRLGVPLLITPKGECLSGDTSIIEYLKGLDLDNLSYLLHISS